MYICTLRVINFNKWMSLKMHFESYIMDPTYKNDGCSYDKLNLG